MSDPKPSDSSPTPPPEAGSAEFQRTLTYADILPTEVSPGVYKKTKENLEMGGWQIFRLQPISLRTFKEEGKIMDNAFGSDTNKMLDYTPLPIEIAINPKTITLEPANQPLSVQISQLDQFVHSLNHSGWLRDGEELEPEDRIDGVKASLLPGAAVAQLAEAFRERNHELLLADVTREESDSGISRVVTPFAVSCIDSPDGNFRLSIKPDHPDRNKLLISFYHGTVPAPNVRVLRALILPTPKTGFNPEIDASI